MPWNPPPPNDFRSLYYSSGEYPYVLLCGCTNFSKMAFFACDSCLSSKISLGWESVEKIQHSSCYVYNI
uniref:Uncharacterized protein n=1 Tax=Anguilla anguilla TaxID=7936 RepID=A0A0E9U1N8_ANGAN